MPKHYCDYCDVYLTHDSASVRKAHNSGRNHLANVRDYYASLGHDKAQSIIDQITAAYESSGGPPPGGFNFGPQHLGAPPPWSILSLLIPILNRIEAPPFPPGPGFPPMMPPPFPPNGPIGARGMGPPPPGGFPGGPPPFPPNGPPGGNLPPFPPQNAGAAPPSNFPPPGGNTNTPPNGPLPSGGPPSSGPSIHPDRLKMMSSGR
ncbi:U1 zinc finger-domain-containing protein [Amanita rubescens]|nr:U1 zinc finger-domain-containing protein [Amanita rubescens]